MDFDKHPWIVLCFLLALVAAPAWADWLKVAETNESISYIDPATIRKEGNFRKAWEVKDWKQRTKDGVMSMRGLMEYDCREKRYRGLAISTYSGPMLAGQTLYSYNDPERGEPPYRWDPILPNTPAEVLLKRVCAK